MFTVEYQVPGSGREYGCIYLGNGTYIMLLDLFMTFYNNLSVEVNLYSC